MHNLSIRTPLLLIGIFLLTMFGVVLLYLNVPAQDTLENEELNESSLDVYSAQQQVAPLLDEAIITTKNGSYIKTRNFIMDDDVQLFDGGAETYLLDQELGKNGPVFQIFYYKGGGITVSLLDPDLVFARNQAETALQKRLGLTLLEMCAITIRVTTPTFVNEKLSARDLGLSFCPGSINL